MRHFLAFSVVLAGCVDVSSSNPKASLELSRSEPTLLRRFMSCTGKNVNLAPWPHITEQFEREGGGGAWTPLDVGKDQSGDPEAFFAFNVSGPIDGVNHKVKVARYASNGTITKSDCLPAAGG